MAKPRMRADQKSGAASVASMESVQAHLQHAKTLHKAGMLEDAECAYRNILARLPGNLDALHHLSALHCQTGRFESGAKLIARALKIRPDWAVLHYNRGL